MTIDKERLRVLAEAVKGWGKHQGAWASDDPGVAHFGAIDPEDDRRMEVGTVDTGNYYRDQDALPLAEFYAAADPTTVLTLLSENAAIAAEVERLRGYIVRMRDSLKFGAITGFEADQCRMGAAFLEAAMAEKGGAPS